MLMACVSLPGGAWPYATLTLAPVQAHTKRSERPRSDRNDSPSFASHVAIQQDRPRSTLLTGLLLKHSLEWWLYHCFPLSIDLVVLPCSIRMARELTASRLPNHIDVKNKKAPRNGDPAAPISHGGDNVYCP
jgi:hypothetical protein